MTIYWQKIALQLHGKIDQCRDRKFFGTLRWHHYVGPQKMMLLAPEMIDGCHMNGSHRFKMRLFFNPCNIYLVQRYTQHRCVGATVPRATMLIWHCPIVPCATTCNNCRKKHLKNHPGSSCIVVFVLLCCSNNCFIRYSRASTDCFKQFQLFLNTIRAKAKNPSPTPSRDPSVALLPVLLPHGCGKAWVSSLSSSEAPTGKSPVLVKSGTEWVLCLMFVCSGVGGCGPTGLVFSFQISFEFNMFKTSKLVATVKPVNGIYMCCDVVA